MPPRNAPIVAVDYFMSDLGQLKKFLDILVGDGTKDVPMYFHDGLFEIHTNLYGVCIFSFIQPTVCNMENPQPREFCVDAKAFRDVVKVAVSMKKVTKHTKNLIKIVATVHPNDNEITTANIYLYQGESAEGLVNKGCFVLNCLLFNNEKYPLELNDLAAAGCVLRPIKTRTADLASAIAVTDKAYVMRFVISPGGIYIISLENGIEKGWLSVPVIPDDQDPDDETVVQPPPYTGMANLPAGSITCSYASKHIKRLMVNDPDSPITTVATTENNMESPIRFERSGENNRLIVMLAPLMEDDVEPPP